MLPRGSISTWISRLASDEELAFSRLHQRLWPSLLARARAKLKNLPSRFANEEDVAQEAFRDFYIALKGGKIPRLSNRHDLLAFLTHVIACKACNLIESEGAEKRGGFRVKDEAALKPSDTGSVVRVLEQFEGNKPDVLEGMLLDECYQ